MDEVKIYELDKSSKTVDKIVEIHVEAFSDFFLTQLGKPFLKTLYQGYIDDENSGVIIAESKNSKEILGFIAYSKDYSRFFAELKRKHLLKFAFCSVGAAVRHPSFIKRLLGAFKKSNEVKRSEKYVELASIGVNSAVQGKGIGGRLVDYLISIVDYDKYEYISLETDALDNEAANRFYQKKGFKLSREYSTAEGRRMNEYRYMRGELK